MKKTVVGYIFDENKLRKDEELFLKVAKKNNIELVMFNVAKDINEQEIEEKAKSCDIIFNNSGEDFAIEISKTIEQLGKKVIESSKAYYYPEDKWIFFLKCKEHKIPTPETILLSENISEIKKELKKFNHWPVIIKRVSGTMGQYVERAENIEEAVKTIQKFWERGSDRLPIIAQEFISSPSYRVTLIGNKIVQTALKENHGWKATGVYAKKFRKFDVDAELKIMIKKLRSLIKINICGLDLLKKDGQWMFLEANSEPAFDFFEDEREKIIKEVLLFLKLLALNNFDFV